MMTTWRSAWRVASLCGVVALCLGAERAGRLPGADDPTGAVVREPAGVLEVAREGSRPPRSAVALEVACFPGGAVAVADRDRKRLSFWARPEGEPAWTVDTDGGWVELALSGDARTLAIAEIRSTAQRSIVLREVAGGKVRAAWKAELRYARVALSRDGSVIAAHVDHDRGDRHDECTIGIWDLSRESCRRVRLASSPGGPLAVSPDGTRVAVADCMTGVVTILDAAAGADAAPVVWKSGARQAWALVRSAAGDRLAVGGDHLLDPADQRWTKGYAAVYDIAGARTVRAFGMSCGYVYSVAFSPDGRRLAVTAGGPYQGGSSRVRVWDIASGEKRWECTGVPWDTTRGIRAQDWVPHSAAPNSAAFVDGGTLVTGCGDGIVRTWRVGER